MPPGHTIWGHSTEREGFEPPSPFGRSLSRRVQYHSASAPDGIGDPCKQQRPGLHACRSSPGVRPPRFVHVSGRPDAPRFARCSRRLPIRPHCGPSLRRLGSNLRFSPGRTPSCPASAGFLIGAPGCTSLCSVVSATTHSAALRPIPSEPRLEPPVLTRSNTVLSGVRRFPNRGARIRTGDLCDPNAALYRTEPRPEATRAYPSSEQRTGWDGPRFARSPHSVRLKPTVRVSSKGAWVRTHEPL